MRFDDFDSFLINLSVLINFKLPNFIKLVYDKITDNILISEEYDSILSLPIEDDKDFLVRGLMLDFVNGNVIRLGSGGYIVAASHGRRPLPEIVIDQLYPGRRWYAVDMLFGDTLAMLNGYVPQRLMLLSSYLEIAVGLVFVRVVETIDVVAPVGINNYIFVYNLITFALKKCLQLNEGYFDRLIDEPENFMNKCDDLTINWLKSLKESKKFVVLLSTENFCNTKRVLKFLLGAQWKTIFTLIVCNHNKIDFFFGNKKFYKSHGDTYRTDTKFFIKGCMTYLNNYIQRKLKKRDPKLLLIGTDMILDTILPNTSADAKNLTIILVCEELKAETPNGLGYDVPFNKILTSEIWGSFFRHENVDMLLSILIRRHSTCVTAGITNLVTHSLTDELRIVPFEDKRVFGD